MAIATATKSILFESAPLSVSMRLTELTGVPAVQQFDSAAGTNGAQWYPDFALVPLTIGPLLTIGGGDSPDLATQLMAEGLQRLEVLSWSVLSRDSSGNVVETVIAAGSPSDMSLVAGSDGKKLSVSRNVIPAEQVSIRLRARYTFLGRSYELEDTFPIRCIPASEGLPKLYASMPAHLVYNPLRDKTEVSMTFELRNAKGPWPHDWGLTVEHEVPDTTGQNKFWQVVGLSGTAAENATDAEFDLTHNTATNLWTLKVDRKLMDPVCRFRVRAWYKLEDGTKTGYDPTAGTNPDMIPEIDFEWLRLISDNLKDEIQGIPDYVPSQDLTYYPTLVLSDSQGMLPEAAYDELILTWYISQGKADGSVSYTLLGTGRKIALSGKKIIELYGCKLKCDATDRGPYGVVIENNTTKAVLTDPSTGKWLIART